MVVTVTSSDLYLRIALSELHEVHLLHSHSEVDPTIAISPPLRRSPTETPLTGYTEWTATVHHRQLSVGWDWYEMEPGALTILHPALLRTNAMLVDGQHSDLGRERTNVCLLGLIRSTDWYTVVADYLALSRAPSKHN